MRVMNGEEELRPSTNRWDWLGSGIYFWEHDSDLAMAYAQEVAKGTQFAKGRIAVPFVIGAIIDLGACLDTTTSGGIDILRNGHDGLQRAFRTTELPMPRNIAYNQRYLDCAVVEFIHQQNMEQGHTAFDTVRGAFQEGEPIYEGAYLTMRNHIQICVRNQECIRGYFLPRQLA
jgi:hypothetical protein